MRLLGNDLRDSVVICRDVQARPLTAAESGDTSVSGFEALLAALRGVDHSGVLPAIGRVFFGAGGDLWVQRDRANPLSPQWPPEGATYDVYGPGGSYEGTLAAPAKAILYGQVGDLVIGYERGAYDEVSIVGYRLGLNN